MTNVSFSFIATFSPHIVNINLAQTKLYKGNKVAIQNNKTKSYQIISNDTFTSCFFRDSPGEPDTVKDR